MNTTTDQITISLPRQSENSLFDGTSAADRAGLDIQNSIDRFEEIYVERVQAAYPDAIVETEDVRRVIVSGIEDPGDDEQAIQYIAEDLFDHGDLWIILKDA